ncbi:20234_t:CDS:1, partial [Funneliformis geosporum]
DVISTSTNQNFLIIGSLDSSSVKYYDNMYFIQRGVLDAEKIEEL